MSTDPKLELLEQAQEALASRLPDGWEVERAYGRGSSADQDVRFAIGDPNSGGSGSLIVEAALNFAPADVERLLGGMSRRLLDAAGTQILLVSTFLSPRSRELLEREGVNYLDLTGNTRIVLRHPGLFVETSGANRRPKTDKVDASAGLSGPTVGRIVRFLAEVEPPYGVLDIEEQTKVSRGYVSRVLERLSEEALIQREKRGKVESVDWPALLRRRSEEVDLLKVNSLRRSYITPRGVRATFESLTTSSLVEQLLVTGSFAAVRKAPIAAPAMLMMYLVPGGRTPYFDEIQDEFGLLPSNESPDLMLFWPPNDRIVERPDRETGSATQFVNLPQLVVDCLGGPGRMPAEGEALLEWMQLNQSEWRFDSLADLKAAKQ